MVEMRECPFCGVENRADAILCGSCYKVVDSRRRASLSELLENAADAPYRELVQTHVRRFSSEELYQGAKEEMELLASRIRQSLIDWPQIETYLEALATELGEKRAFWATATCEKAVLEILPVADRTLELDGKVSTLEDALTPGNEDLGFGVFQIATLIFAYAASTKRSNRKLMGIKKGLFG